MSIYINVAAQMLDERVQDIATCDANGCDKEVDVVDPIEYPPDPRHFCSKDCAYDTIDWLYGLPARQLYCNECDLVFELHRKRECPNCGNDKLIYIR